MKPAPMSPPAQLIPPAPAAAIALTPSTLLHVAQVGDETVEFSRYEVETLLDAIDGSLRIENRGQFFLWPRGALQGLIPHGLLACVACDPRGAAPQNEFFPGEPWQENHLARLGRGESGLLAQLMRRWQSQPGKPLYVVAGEANESSPAGELRRMGLRDALVHGLCQATGEPASLFAFLNLPERPKSASEGTLRRGRRADLEDEAEGEEVRNDGKSQDGPSAHARSRRDYVLRMLVPYLHAADVRARAASIAEAAPVPVMPKGVLTEREIEILDWVRQGKSNADIGGILQISPLTVKNHVQKILRKLNAQNRTQAVSKGLALSLLKR